MRLGMMVFIIPFVFCFNPALLLYGSAPEVIVAIASAVVGILFLVQGIERHVLGAGKIGWMAGGVLILSSVALFSPSWQLQSLGLGAGAATTFLVILLRKRLLSSKVQRVPVVPE
jgi:TRAP-type uncharacterized transport system fused permease subunit